MNRKQKLIISITGITIVALALLGLTYGYYLTRIQGNTNTNSISITTADLTLKYDDGSSYINLSNIMPGTITDGENGNPEPKVFTVTNDGSGDVEYSIGMDEVTNTLTRTQDLTYSITCVEKLIDSADTSYKACATTPSNSGEYPKTNSYLFTNQIKQDYIQKYTVIISYANPDEDQSIDMGSTIKGRMQIYSLPESIDITGTVTGASKGDYVQINSNPKTSVIASDGTYKLIGVEPGSHTLSIKNGTTTKGTKEIVVKQGATAGIDGNTITFTQDERVATVNVTSISTTLGVNITEIKDENILLKDAIMNDTRITKNEGTPDFTTIADYKTTGDASSGEIGMYSTEDDYGTSWYFRGAQSYNYVNFAGFIWRIMRINGDNTIRLILDGSLDKVDNCDDSDSGVNFCDIVAFYDDECANLSCSLFYGGVGYMHGSLFDSNGDYTIDYDIQNSNLNDSDIKTYNEAFYYKYIKLGDFEKYIADTLFCGEKTVESEPYGGRTFGAAYADFTSKTRFDNNIYTLKCADVDNDFHTEEQKAYSRYTAKLDTSTTTNKGVLVNNDLTFPIGTISYDEYIMAGGKYNTINNFYYLYNEKLSENGFWTMTAEKEDQDEFIYFVKTSDIWTCDYRACYKGYRPVINLRSDVLINTGNGTVESPYTVKLPS